MRADNRQRRRIIANCLQKSFWVCFCFAGAWRKQGEKDVVFIGIRFFNLRNQIAYAFNINNQGKLIVADFPASNEQIILSVMLSLRVYKMLKLYSKIYQELCAETIINGFLRLSILKSYRSLTFINREEPIHETI